MNTLELLWISFRKYGWKVILLLCVIPFIEYVSTTFGSLITWLINETNISLIDSIGDIQQFISLLTLTAIILIATICVMFKQIVDVPEQKNDFSFKLMTIAFGVLSFMLMILVWVMFSPYMLKFAGHLLGTAYDEFVALYDKSEMLHDESEMLYDEPEILYDKSETLSTIGYGMGGVLAFIGAISINNRANAEAENNKLIEKGHDNERFQNITKDLGHNNAVVRVAAFYRFYYLALKESKKGIGKNKKLAKDIFEILCSCLRIMPIKKDRSEQETPKHATFDTKCDSEKHIPSEEDVRENVRRMDKFFKERQTLCNILFKGKFKGKIKDKFKNKLKDRFKNNPGFGIENKHPLIQNTIRSDLQYAYLACMNFSYADLSYVDFSHANLSHTNFFRADILHAIFTHTNLSCSDLRLADIMDANLAHTNLANTKLSGANLTKANFRESTLTNARIRHANLANAKFRHANLENASLAQTNLTNADLGQSNLIKTDFRRANLSNARLLHADLSQANLFRANLSRANLSYANLSYANLSDANLSDANLSLVISFKMNLSGANLSGANLSNAILSDADLSNSNCRKAKLKSEQLQNVSGFDQADFRDTGIKLADLPLGKGTPFTDE